jgi:signal transduction histidine kinase
MMALCPWEPAQYFIFSSNVPNLLYYSHFVAVLVALVFTIFICLKKRDLVLKILTYDLLFFIAWVVLDVFLWASNRPDVVLFYWSIQIILELLVYLTSFYFAYVFIKGQDLPFKLKVVGSLSILPILFLMPTKDLLPGMDIVFCNAIESEFVVLYSYAFEILFSFLILFLGFNHIRSSTSQRRKEIVFFVAGLITFLIAFSSGNLIGSISEDWNLAQAGLFGMPVFIGFLAYSVVKYKSFNVKVIGTQVLVTTLWISLLAVLFVGEIDYVRIIVSITLILFLIIGIKLIRSVKREVEQRERIQALALDLKVANDRLKELDQMKSEFLSLATHQIRSPLTSIKGYASLLLDGDYGTLDEKAKEGVKIIFNSCDNLVKIVGDFLNISRIEQGRMAYNKEVFDLALLSKETANEYKPNIDKAKLSLALNIPETVLKVNADKVKTKEIVGNLIDNAIKYTKQGGITVSVGEEGGKVKVSVKDTGIGIDPGEIYKLFNKFSRTKDAHKTSVTGTGLGLYIAKQMTVAQGGDIEVFSEGENKGTTFTLKLPKSS